MHMLSAVRLSIFIDIGQGCLDVVLGGLEFGFGAARVRATCSESLDVCTIACGK